MVKQTPTTISVPTSFVIRLAAAGRILRGLAEDLQAAQSGTVVRRKPKNVPKDQEWYWTEKWQQWEKEADEELARGEFKAFDNIEDLIADLHSHV